MGVKVMLDFEIAEMYGVETRRLNESVKRNLERFPEDFMFQLTNQEFANLKSQIATSSWGGTRKNPYVFSEHGVAILSGLLRSPVAIQVNINIIRAFVAMRQLILAAPEDRVSELQNDIKELKMYVEDILIDQNEINEDTRGQLEAISMSLAELQAENSVQRKPRKEIKGFRPD
jgi:ORF6N domain.